MGDVFDRIHAQQTGDAGGDVFDRLHAAKTGAQPDIRQPEGSAGARYGGGLWDTTVGGLLKMVPALADIASHAIIGRPFDPHSPGAQAVAGLVQSHLDQSRKAQEALGRGEYTEAAGHVLATALPMIGPAAAHAAERLGGSRPQYDRYGNVVTPGAAPDIAGGLGETTGLLLASGTGEGVRQARKYIPPSVTIPLGLKSRLNPVEQSAVDYLREQDVPLTPGTVTGNRFVKAAEQVVKNQPLGAGRAAEFGRGTEEGLTRVASGLADEAHPEPVSPELAGTRTAGALKGKIEDLGAAADEAYGRAWQGRDDPAFTEKVQVRTRTEPVLDEQGAPTGKMQEVPVYGKVNMPVDVRDIKASLEPVYDEMQWMPAADRASSAGYQAVKNILEGDDFIPAWQAERGLSGLKNMARVTNRSGVRNVSQGLGASIIPDLQESIDAAVARTGDDAISGLQEGRATHADKMDVAEIAEQLRDEPVQTFGKLTFRKDAGIALLRKVAEHAPEMLSQIGRAFVDQLFEQATREGGFSRASGILSQWQNLGPATKQLLFPEGSLRMNLDRFFKGAEMVSQNPNPSGTELVRSATQINPFRWLIGGVGSKLLFSPGSAEALTRGWQVPLGGLRGKVAESGLKNLARDNRLEPPEGPPGPPESGPGGGTPPPTPPAAPSAGGAEGSGIITRLNEKIAERHANQQAFVDQAKTAGQPPPASGPGGSPPPPGRTPPNPWAQMAEQWEASRQAFIAKAKSAGKPVDTGTESVQKPITEPEPDATVEAGVDNAGAALETPSVHTGGTREGTEVSGPDRTVQAINPAAATSVIIPGSERAYTAEYKVRELADIQPSHSGRTFSPNPKYGLRNDRNYSALENQRKVIDWSGPQFEARYHITDNPDASNGPPVINSQGDVIGGNGRSMIMQRVYAGNARGAQAYRDLLMRKASQYGIDPASIAGMKEPVLVREIPDGEIDRAAAQRAVTDFNKKGTAELKPSEKAIADSRGVSQGTLDNIASRLESAGSDATLADILDGRGGGEVLQRLISDGVISPQESAAYVHNEVLTADGKTRIAKLMLGRFFEDSAMLDRTPPSIRNKLERIAAPLSRVEGNPEWSLSGHIQDALALLEEAGAHGARNLDDFVSQSGLFGSQKYPPEAIVLAKRLRSTKPAELTKAVRQYAQDASFADQGSGLFGNPPTRAEAFETAFGRD